MRLQQLIKDGETGQADKQEWLNAVAQLTRDVSEWSRANKWETTASETEISEEVQDDKGVYDDVVDNYIAPVVTIDTGSGRVVLEPIACNVLGARGRVDLYAYPSLFRVMLLRQVDKERPEWTIRTDSGIDWPNEWSKDEFYALVKALSR